MQTNITGMIPFIDRISFNYIIIKRLFLTYYRFYVRPNLIIIDSDVRNSLQNTLIVGMLLKSIQAASFKMKYTLAFLCMNEFPKKTIIS